MNIFHSLVFQPIYNLIIFLVDIFPGADFGLAIIVATVLIKFVFLPLSKKQIESQKQMTELQPKLKEIQEKHKNDKERQSKEIMALYRESGVNPLMGCFPIIIQIIFLIAIYQVILDISSADFVPDSVELYPFVGNPGPLERMFHGTDLATPSIIFAVLAAVGQFYQMKMLMGPKGENARKPEKKSDDTPKEPDFAGMMQKQMLYIGPFMTLFIGLQFPAALSLYWLISTVFSIGQQWFVLGRKKADGHRENGGGKTKETVTEAIPTILPDTGSPKKKNAKKTGFGNQRKKKSHR